MQGKHLPFINCAPSLKPEVTCANYPLTVRLAPFLAHFVKRAHAIGCYCHCHRLKFLQILIVVPNRCTSMENQMSSRPMDFFLRDANTDSRLHQLLLGRSDNN